MTAAVAMVGAAAEPAMVGDAAATVGTTAVMNAWRGVREELGLVRLHRG